MKFHAYQTDQYIERQLSLANERDAAKVHGWIVGLRRRLMPAYFPLLYPIFVVVMFGTFLMDVLDARLDRVDWVAVDLGLKLFTQAMVIVAACVAFFVICLMVAVYSGWLDQVAR